MLCWDGGWGVWWGERAYLPPSALDNRVEPECRPGFGCPAMGWPGAVRGALSPVGSYPARPRQGAGGRDRRSASWRVRCIPPPVCAIAPADAPQIRVSGNSSRRHAHSARPVRHEPSPAGGGRRPAPASGTGRCCRPRRRCAGRGRPAPPNRGQQAHIAPVGFAGQSAGMSSMPLSTSPVPAVRKASTAWCRGQRWVISVPASITRRRIRSSTQA
jgi:hypothetical protein